MGQPNRNQSSKRWIKQAPRVPSTRKGLAPVAPAYIPARAKPAKAH